MLPMCPTQTEAELAVFAKPTWAYQPFPCRAQIYNPMGMARMATVGCAQGRKGVSSPWRGWYHPCNVAPICPTALYGVSEI